MDDIIGTNVDGCRIIVGFVVDFPLMERRAFEAKLSISYNCSAAVL